MAIIESGQTQLDTESLETNDLEGVRLAEFQILNWGTFDGQVARLPMYGQNALLTGQVGSGKSTIVDAVTTLFAQASRVTFNRAAGAESRERTVTSYVLGHHRNTYDEITGTQKPEALRTPKTAFSVILARFTGVPTSATNTCTAGVIYWFSDGASVPNRFYFTSPAAIDIADHLIGHRTMRDVRAALRDLDAKVEDTFTNYARNLCRALGTSRPAFDLLVQTISMKQVGNLTEFVRDHMLEASDVDELITRILAHYADLVRSHELVQDARRQLDKLAPVVEHANRFDRADERITLQSAALRAVPQVVAGRRIDLLTMEIGVLDEELPKLDHSLIRLAKELQKREGEYLQLEIAVANEGGAELSEAEHGISNAKARLTSTRIAAAEMQELAATASVQAPETAADHPAFTRLLTQHLEQLTVDEVAANEQVFSARTNRDHAQQDVEALERELQQTGTRPSNVPEAEDRIRERVAQGVGIDPAELPFIAELVMVAPEHAAWELAAERLVRGFALSMLVPTEHYPAVASWVDENNLRGKLDYYPVADDVRTPRPAAEGTIAACLRVRPDHWMAAWVAGELARRFTHLLLEDPTQLRTHSRAVTVAGQIKERDRHTKDDRGTGRRSYVLGWDTAARRDAIIEDLAVKKPQLGELDAELGERHNRARSLRERQYATKQLTARFSDPDTIDVASAVRALVEAEQLLADLKEMAKDLAALTDRRDKALELVDALKEREGRLRDRRGGARERRSQYQRQLDAAHAEMTGALRVALTDEVQVALDEALARAGQEPAQVVDVQAWATKLTADIQGRIDSATATRERSGRDLVGAMKDFAGLWEALVTELDPTQVVSRDGFRELKDRIENDDLPRFEKNFREQLETNAIHELVAFAKFLEREEKSMTGRIETINQALNDIDYHPGTYIRLEPDPTPDPTVREFRGQLRNITQGALLGDDDTYAETRFLLVKDLLDRFAGREGSTTQDKAWTDRVTDVRNWFTFAAAERRRGDGDALVEHYTDSGGKSGGQKEKLAYTVLAAALSYQYGLASGNRDAFRFVMIDEAFGRGSDESTRFGLELFTRLGLQLMVVTPLQKIEAIEPHVKAVGYVRAGDPRSRLLSLTIEELRKKRELWRRASRAGDAFTVVAEDA
ncbi:MULTISPECIES: ATP-binding protein [unclassified Nocardioides]|uniref:ATP-binding protein n=1 Tax=unclassified Nocardioides TaxID=2615069 RepID=UPI000AE00131|nr:MULTISPECIES: SbcC/MukB-like Walker B domain-containing protein [unclassified Nocardioides]